MLDDLYKCDTTDITDIKSIFDLSDISEFTDLTDAREWSGEYTDRRTRTAAIPYRRKQLTKAAAILVVFVTLITVTFLFATQAGYSVYMNGRSLGSAKDMVEVQEAVESVENQVSQILGYDYSLDGSIQVGAGISVFSTDKKSLEEAMLSNVDGIARMYTLKVNGNIVAACADEGVLDSILGEILDSYSTDNTTSVLFSEKVSISYEYIKSDVLQDPGEIRALLDPANNKSDIRLTVKDVENVQSTVEVDYDCDYIYDDTAYEGTETVVSPGKKGISDVVEQVLYVNGAEEGRRVVSNVTVEQPVNEVVCIGTKYRPPYVSYGEYHWPASGTITSYFGYRVISIGASFHHGIDIAGSYGQEIYAADGGEVIYADWESCYGYILQIQHDNGDVTCYGHCSEFAVKVGDKVARGDVVAYMGSTGLSTGVHLHFEVRVDGTAVDPMDYLP